MIPNQASARIQRWAIILFCVVQHINTVTQIPLPRIPERDVNPTELVLLMNVLEESAITAVNIREWTKRDPILSKVHHFLQFGWPDKISPELKVFYKLKEELSIIDGCVLRGSRVIVPPQGRKQILSEYHEGHPGICRMKAVARMYNQIERVVKSCEECQKVKLHLDYVGPFEGKMFLIVVDVGSNSKIII